MRNFLPCKKTNQSNCDGQTAAPTVIYEDLTEVLQRTNPNHNTGHIKHPSMEVSNEFGFFQSYYIGTNSLKSQTYSKNPFRNENRIISYQPD